MFVCQTEGTVPPPHLIVVSPGEYILESSEFDNPEPDAKDKLLPRGHNLCKCEEYNLGEHYIEWNEKVQQEQPIMLPDYKQTVLLIH